MRSGIVRERSHVPPSKSPCRFVAKIEGAKPGDEGDHRSGHLQVSVYLQTKATTTQPIVIHAKESANPPVWDLNGSNVEAAPGTTPRGIAAGCWQFSGAEEYPSFGLVITGLSQCRFTPRVRYYDGFQGDQAQKRGLS